MRASIDDKVTYRRKGRKRCYFGWVVDVRKPLYIEIQPTNAGWKRIWIDEREVVRWTWDKPVKPKKNGKPVRGT